MFRRASNATPFFRVFLMASALVLATVGCSPSSTDIVPQDGAPVITGARVLNTNSIMIEFAHPVGPEADDASSYTIMGPKDAALPVLDVEVDADRTAATLTTADQQSEARYELGMTGTTETISVDTLTPPRVVGAVSISNTEVIVTFNKNMGAGAEDPANYVIRQENQGAEAGILIVESAEFNLPQKDAVKLTTLSQNELTYAVNVTNVRDLWGNQIAPRELLVDPSFASFRGTPPSGVPNDTDGDGIPDHVEQRGWVVTVELTARTGLFERFGAVTRDVTSDPNLSDTDGDGLSDLTERELATDPREPDTDADGLGDFEEFNIYFSSPVDQDTDEDQLDDFLEVTFYKTSPILGDTDGDDLNDDVEILSLNRNPRVSDLPEWSIDVGEIRLQIDERYTYVDETGETITQTTNTTSTLSETSETSSLAYDSKVTDFGWNVGGKIGAEISATPKATVEVSGGLNGNTQTKSGRDTTTTESLQEDYERSLSRGREFTTTREVTREVFGASIDAPLTVRATGDIAFSIANLELSVLQLGRDRETYVPVATLVPNSELLTGEETTLNLGPFVSERGPINLGTQEAFPSLVEDLLRAPRGPVIVPANFDIIDEFGRNFAFASQEANDRTATLVIDFGDGTVERFNVAIAGAIDDNGYVGPVGGFVGGFDEDGKIRGIPLDFALRDILGFSKNSTELDSIVAGENGIAETVADGDDIQEIPPGTTGLDDRAVIISAGDNGILDSIPANDGNVTPEDILDDLAAVTRGYETASTCNVATADRIIEPNDPTFGNGTVDTILEGDDQYAGGLGLGSPVDPGTTIIEAGLNGIIESVPAGDDERRGPGTTCDDNADCPNGACDGREVLKRFGSSTSGNRNRAWLTYSSDEVPVGTNFGEVTLKPRMILFLGFEQDIDRDGLFARHEYQFGSSDRDKDTDGDGLGDFAEIRQGWLVEVAGRQGYKAFPDPGLADSDGDGVNDADEMTCGTDPRKRDTDDDGISDGDEIQSAIDAGSDCTTPPTDDGNGLFAYLDALNPDTDGDGLLDGIEEALGSNNRDANDASEFLDTDEDGLANNIESVGGGWNVSVELCNNTCELSYDGVCHSGACFGPPLNGGACAVDSECNPTPLCEPAGWCASGPIVPGVCSSDPECATYNVCVPILPPILSFCGGDGAFCITDLDCDGSCILNACDANAVNAFTACDDAGDCVAHTSVCLTDCPPGTDCADCGSATSSEMVFSDPSIPDTDFDGLPDLLERTIGTNPTDIDTDGDGLLDFDEFDRFGEFLQNNFLFNGFFLTDVGSQQIGTDPRSQDSDDDGLSDNFERLDGWRVSGPFDPAPRDVFSSPLLADSDLDGLTDSQEYLGRDGIPQGFPGDSGDATDPNDPDTDDDGTSDFEEDANNSDPLLPDVTVTIESTFLAVRTVTGGAGTTSVNFSVAAEVVDSVPALGVFATGEFLQCGLFFEPDPQAWPCPGALTSTTGGVLIEPNQCAIPPLEPLTFKVSQGETLLLRMEIIEHVRDSGNPSLCNPAPACRSRTILSFDYFDLASGPGWQEVVSDFANDAVSSLPACSNDEFTFEITRLGGGIGGGDSGGGG